MNEKVTTQFNKFVEEKLKAPDSHKTKLQKAMTAQDRDENISQMLNRASLHVGMGPIMAKHVDLVEENLIKRGVLKRSKPKINRRARTIKSLVKTWAMRNLNMTDRDWDDISIEEITLSENTDTIFLRCTNYKDAAKITGNAKYLPKENNTGAPKLSMYVDN